MLGYVAELRKLAPDCNYGDNLQQMLRDRLICGINDERIQRRFLAEHKLTFDKALSIAVAVETAKKNTQVLNPSASVQFMETMRGSQETSAFKEMGQECYRCKGTKHNAANCKFKQEKCHACGKVGHIARACRNTNTQNQGSRGSEDGRGEKKRGFHHRSHNMQETLKASKSDSSEENTQTLYSMKFRLGQMSEVHLRIVDPYMVKMKLNLKKAAF